MARPNPEAIHQSSKRAPRRPPNGSGRPTERPTPQASGKASQPIKKPCADSGAAFARVRPEIDALPREQVRRINLYVPAAVTLVLGVLPRLLSLREQMKKDLPNHPADALDKLRDYALALYHAHILTLPRDKVETHLRTLLSEAMPLRERLLRSAELLADFGLVDAKRVAAIRRGAGHIDAANDLLALGILLRKAWPALAGKTPLTLDEVGRAEDLGVLLIEALGQRQLGTDGSADPREAEVRRAKAYTLFFRAYDECRRAVIYLRWREGDADQIAPSLLQARGRRRRGQVDELAGPARVEGRDESP
jgi:hypothetical protein